MPNYQKIQIMGHLGKDPETRHLESGNSVTTFPLACTEKWKDKNGEQREKTEWFNIEAWGKQGEILAQYLKIGSAIFVEGKQETDVWENNEGVKQYRQKVRVSSFQFLGGKSQDESAPNTGNNSDDLRF